MRLHRVPCVRGRLLLDILEQDTQLGFVLGLLRAALYGELTMSNYSLQEEERQLIVLSLALCALLRPGFESAVGNIAEKLDGRDMFNEFRRLNADVVSPQAMLRLLQEDYSGFGIDDPALGRWLDR